MNGFFKALGKGLVLLVKFVAGAFFFLDVFCTPKDRSW